MDRSTVVVTGIGLETGLGIGREFTWNALCAGRSGIRRLADERHQGRSEFFGSLFLGDDQRFDRHVTWVTNEAMTDAQLVGATGIDRDRVATIVGLSKGDLLGLTHRHADMLRDGPDAGVGRGDWTTMWPHSSASDLSILYDFRGPNLSPIAACATGVMAAIQGADLIRRGTCDLAIVGAGDASLHPLVFGAFRNMKALARMTDDPACAVRPWDQARSGFVPGEGVAILILERSDHARARGVLPYAEFAGGAFGSDAYHMTDLNPDPAGLAHLIGRALENSDAAISDIDQVNVHGTATRQNDPLECRAIRRAFGRDADGLSCSANKPQIGHLLGAAGAAELAITCLAIRDGFIPPTLNLDDPDPACDLDGTPHVGKRRDIRAALKLSIGFGGHLAAAVLRKPDGSRRQAPDLRS